MTKFLLLACAIALPIASNAQKGRQIVRAPGVELKADIPYTKGEKGDLLANLTLPAKTPGKLVPVVIYIHGGTWIGGNRGNFDWMAAYMAERGIAGLDIDYDLTPDGGHFPISLDESWQAVRWVHEHGKEYGLDDTRIGVAGGSAGGELAGLVALGVRQPKDIPQVKVGALFNGAIDLHGSDTNPGVNLYLTKPCSKVPDICSQASPMNAVHAGAPTFYVGHGTADKAVPYTQAVEFVAKLRAAGVKVTTFVAKDGPHGYFSKEPWREPNMVAAAAFFKESL